MFSFFTKKPKADDVQGQMRRAFNDLRSEIGEDAVTQGMELNNRISRLRSVDLEFIQSLLELTDEITDRVREQYQGFGQIRVLEIDALCAAIVATAIIASEIQEDEAREVIDIYLGLWTGTAVENHQGIGAAALKDRMDDLWLEYSRLILRAYGEETSQIMINEDSASRILVRTADRLAQVKRPDGNEGVAAVIFKTTISETVRIVNANFSEGLRDHDKR